jgi:hypothetical protein
VQARAAVFEHVLEHPRDALIAQLNSNVFGLIGFSGETGREAALLAYTTQLLPHYGEDWWMQSMHALALCETGRVADSLTLMERSLAANPRNANASHFKSHGQYEAGETAAGLAYLKGWMPGYDRRGVLHGHLSWHVALWSLHAGDTEGMWALIDADIGPDGSESLPINVLTDTAAILWRAELAGVAVPPHRWEQLSSYASRFFPETGQSFADIHAALAHAMAGDGDSLDKIATAPKGYARDLAAPVAQAWRAITRQDWHGALEHLTPVMAHTERLGGSRAQRDLLEFTWANVLMKLGHAEEAARAIRTRRPVFGAEVPIHGMH